MKTMRALASAVLSLALIFAALPVVPAFAREAGTDDASASEANAPGAAQQQQGANAGAELNRGKSLLRRGRAAQSLVHLENALRLYTQANNDQGIAASNDALGELYEQQGQYAVALARYQSAHEAFARAASRRSAAANFVGLNNDEYNAKLALAKIGNMHARRGDAAAARAAYAQMNATRPETGSIAAAPVRRRGGLLGSAIGAATGAALGGVSGASAAGAAVGAALAIGQAFGVYRQSIIYATHEIGLGRLSYQSSQLDAAKTHFDNALASANIPIISSFGQSRRFRIAARTGLGDVAFRQGRHQDAVRLYGEAANGARSDNRLDLQWPAQRGLGRARWALAAQERNERRAGQLREESLTAYRDALRTIETIRAGSLRADEARTTFVATTKDVFDEASGALAEMALLVAGANTAAPLQGRALEYASESFKITEQGRARSLLEMLGEVGAEITEGVPAELLQRRQQNLDRQEELGQELSGVTTGTNEPRRPVGEVETELDRLQTELDSIENQIRAASPRYATLTAPQPLTLAEVQQRVLDEQTVLLAYSLGNERSYLWAVGPGSVTLHRLPARASIEQQTVEFRNQIVPAQQARSILSAETQRGLGLGAPATGAATAQPAANVAPFAAAAHALYQTIVAPAASQLGERRLLIIPDGALNYIPFAALVTAPGGADYTALAYLVKTNEVIYAPSASVVAAVRAQRQTAPAASGGILLVADPVFDRSDPRARGTASAQTGGQAGSEVTRGLGLGSAVADVTGAPQANAGGNTPEVRLARLQGARVEAEQIAQLARTTNRQPSTWLDLEASESNLKTRDLRNYRVIHVATHGLLNTERPQFTGLVFSLVGNREEDGFLRTDEVFNLRLGAPLVMLSACETGLGRERRGEGVMGLTRAFMYAGAPTVGVTLWSVVDRSTAELMTDFYRRHLAAESAPAPTALRAAQQSMIANQRYSAPRYWAPFTLVGDWR